MNMISQTSSLASRHDLPQESSSITAIRSPATAAYPRAGFRPWSRVACLALALTFGAATAHADPLDHWTKVPRIPTQEYQNDVIFANGKYWAVSEFGDMQYSADGQTWVDVQTNTFKDLHSIAYGQGRYVIVGGSRIILSSPDGITWTTHKQVAGDHYSQVIFANGKFLTVSPNGETQTSANGVDWTTGNLNVTDFTAWGLTWGNGLYVVVGQGSSGNVVVTSPDAVSWTKRTHGLYSTLNSIAYSNGLFVAVGDTAIGTSPDGISWTKRVGPLPDSGFLTKVNFVNGRFVAAGWYGLLMSSPDGVAWTTHATGTDAAISCFAYNGSRLLTFRYGEYAPAGPWESAPWATAGTTPPPGPTSGRIANISTRGWVGQGDAQLITGFVLQGTSPTKVLIRAVGPTLGAFGVTGALADPQIRLFDSTSTEISSNNDWGAAANQADIATSSDAVFAFALPAGSKDSVILTTLQPGSYTIQISGAGSTTGVALAEVYDIDAPSTGRLVNISTRGFVGSGDNVTIPGFVVAGNAPKRLLIRGVGPTLSTFGVPGVLADPKIAVFNAAQNQIAENDNWTTFGDQAALAAATAQVNAFALQSGSMDSATIVTLDPGSYTVIVAGTAHGTGVGLVEIYELP